jgi:four helix bundle protein
MNERAAALQERTMRFAVRITRFCHTLPDTWEGRHVRDQLFRAGTGTASNYHSACRSRSRRDFISKIGIVVEESDESAFWLNFLKRAEIQDTPEGTELLNEARELLAIFTQSAKTASANHQ